MDLLGPGIILGGAGWVVALVAAVFVGRSRGQDRLIELQRITIDELDEREERIRSDLGRQLTEQDRRCAEEIAQLRGQVEALTPAFASLIAAAVIEHLKAGGMQ